MRKIAPETERAETKRLATTVILRGANRPKLVKIIESQKTKTISRRHRDRADSLLHNQPTRLTQRHQNAHGLRLDETLLIGCGREFFDAVIKTFSIRGRFKPGSVGFTRGRSQIKSANDGPA